MIIIIILDTAIPHFNYTISHFRYFYCHQNISAFCPSLACCISSFPVSRSNWLVYQVCLWTTKTTYDSTTLNIVSAFDVLLIVRETALSPSDCLQLPSKLDIQNNSNLLLRRPVGLLGGVWWRRLESLERSYCLVTLRQEARLGRQN